MGKHSKELEVALGAVRQAAVLCQAVQAEITPAVLEKKDRSPVTVADFGSQALICRMLGQYFPNDPVIGEEDAACLRSEENITLREILEARVQAIVPDASGDQILDWIDRGGASEFTERFWTLDPIDGTKGFLRGEQYAISLALIVDGEIVVAALGCPNLPADPKKPAQEGTAFAAIKGHGAFQVSLSGEGDPVRVAVSDCSDPTQIRFCESVEKAHSSHDDAARIAEHLGIVAAPVRLDSQAKYAVVSRGDAEAYLRLPRGAEYKEKIWDHAGGVLVLTEAGGRVTDIRGLDLEFTHGRTLESTLGVIVSSGGIHDNILEAIETLEIGKF